ncbi:MAG: CIA30 family protein [Acidobacteria bacterium]|nr:CIA30 family protein [Acidobacteriota bacterium]
MSSAEPAAPKRRRLPWASSLLLAVFVLLGAYLLHAALWRPLGVTGEPPADGFRRVAGVVHVHTTASDGGGTPQEVIASARAAGLDFLVLTDHNNLDAKAFEGRHDRLLVLVGTEISTTAGHVLGMGIPDPTFRFSGDAEDALDDVRELGGVSFAAHPTSPLPAFRWTGWGLSGPWGVELINGDSQWREAGWLRLARTAVLYAANRRYALLTSLSPPDATLARWDSLLRQRNAAGLAGADAHSHVRLGKQAGVRFPSYEALFGLVRNHVLLEGPPTGDPAADGRAILGALARGRSYVALDALAPAGGFSFVAERDGGRWTMGDVVPAGGPVTFRAGGQLPAGARLLLLRDGRVVSQSETRLEFASPEPGVYRVEVRLRGWDVPWVISNPLYVFDSVTAEERVRRGAWPAPAQAPAAARILESFEGASAFAPEFDPSSSVAAPTVDPTAGPDGRGAARMAFALGAPGPGRPYTWCALVDRAKRDLSGRAGLVFSIRGDGAFRLWVQVRDENPASADEGTEWWFASVRTSPEWRRVALPFARLRSLNKATDGRLDLDRVRGLAFILDGGAVKVGTRGTVWIDDVGVYDPVTPTLKPAS